MERRTILILFALVTTLLSGQEKSTSALELFNLGTSVPSLEDLHSPPVAKGEKVGAQGACGEVWVLSEKSDRTVSARKTYQGERPVVIAFCWLDEIRSKFNLAEKDAETEKLDRLVTFIRTVQLELTSDPTSYYNRMRTVYCENGGTFYMDLTNQVRECAATSPRK